MEHAPLGSTGNALRTFGDSTGGDALRTSTGNAWSNLCGVGVGSVAGSNFRSGVVLGAVNRTVVPRLKTEKSWLR
jgi:hypothetical protein